LNNQNLISVIIPTFNRLDFLEEAILSVVNQTYKEIEILVIDDGSDIKYAEEICNKYNQCVYLYKENGGLSSARNYGIRKAKGNFIAFLDDDDLWRHDKIEIQLKSLKDNPDIDCIHSSAKVINEKGIETGEIIGASDDKAHKRSGYVFWNALGVWVVKSPTPLIRKKVFKNYLFFDETIRVGEDIDFYQRLFYKHKVLYINDSLAFYREYSNANRLSLMTDKYIGIEKKLYLNLKKLGFNSFITKYKVLHKLANAAKKRKLNSGLNDIDESLLNRCLMFVNPLFFLNKYSK
tara:strand:+ start:12351 stop:13226 length:876 start_codon:yes stop_codon:yes gene_type:complete